MSRSSLLGGLVAALLVLTAIPAQAQEIEDYAPYQPQTKCSPKAKPGAKALLRYVVHHFGGAAGGISRPCSDASTSEHQEGRALDWTLDAERKVDRASAQAFLDFVLAADAAGDQDARARRMGIMYIIWDDHIYSSWNQFEPSDYLSSSCKKLTKCSKTLRHRDHLHVSLTRQAGRGLTSWYAGRLG
jgi:hypothetical protein